jgi:hypothetical protein
MSRIIGHLALVVAGAERRAALLAHLEKLERTAEANFGEPEDLKDFQATAQVTRKRLKVPLERAKPSRKDPA